MGKRFLLALLLLVACASPAPRPQTAPETPSPGEQKSIGTVRVTATTLNVRPGHDAAIARRMTAYYDARYGLSDDFIKVPEFAIARPDPFGLVPCAR